MVCVYNTNELFFIKLHMFYFTCNPQESRHFFHTPALLSKTIATYVHVHMKSNPYSLIFPMD